MRRAALVALLLAAVVVGNLTLPSWHRALYRPVPYSSPVDILLDVLGEIRTFMARMLWFKMDVYHHAMELQGIPWTRERELLPFYKLTLLLDPRFEDVYDLASYDLAINMKKPAEGLELLDQGLKYLPRSFTLHYDKAFLLQRLKRCSEAIPPALYALELLADDPRTLRERRVDALNCLRILAHCFRETGQRQHEIDALRQWLALAPDDPVPRERLRQMGVPP